MSSLDLDKIILGHNQFFGTDHMSQERGAQKDQTFSQIDAVMDLIEYSYSLGVTGLMLSTHERAKSIAEKIKQHPILKDNLNIYILLPYMAKYVRAANEKGIVTMITETLADASWGQRFEILAKGGWGVLSKDIESILEAMITIELLPFKCLRMKAVFLHNALTDLAVGYGLIAPLQFFMKT